MIDKSAPATSGEDKNRGSVKTSLKFIIDLFVTEVKRKEVKNGFNFQKET
jgi:hypothetical protein